MAELPPAMYSAIIRQHRNQFSLPWTEDVKVLGVLLSPFVIRVLIALRLKRVEYELVEVRFLEPNLPALTIALRVEMKATKVTKLASQFRQVLGLLEEAFTECGKGKGFFGGDAVGYLDIALGSGLGWIMAVEKGKSVKLLDAEELPRLAGWAKRFLVEESVKGLVPDGDEYLKFSAATTARTSSTPEDIMRSKLGFVGQEFP
ncbi:hypothetical protein ZIOFF_010289 [Zingiber officinale]|uniref:Glutathione S-transferase n=1 Tax=Zingiber officinale TaxID=94328 RepID=A0A8J5LP93_ZINOF|nr:hypothetical protein ZIOFF_010289 [Zingiber officinale]